MRLYLTQEELDKTNELVDKIVKKNKFQPKAYKDGDVWKIGFGTPSFEGEEIDELEATVRLNEQIQGWFIRAIDEGMSLIEAFMFAKMQHGFKRTRKRVLDFFHRVLDGDKVAKLDGMEDEDYTALVEFWGSGPDDRKVKRPTK